MVYGTQHGIKMEIVIIGHNESEYISKMLESLRKYPYKRIWILDRCTDNSEEILKKENEFYIKTPEYLIGRQTSFARNLGLFQTESDVLFLDADRYIKSGSLKTLTKSEKDISLLLLENDHRENLNIDKCYGTVHNGFYSCGVFIKRDAIDKILKFQNNELFSIDMQDLWGIEDVYLGDVCYHLGLSCEINKNIRLQGSFNRLHVDSIKTIEKRFNFREKLNVLWN